MLHKFDYLVLDGDNLVLSNNLNVLSNTLLISLSLHALNEEDICHIFTIKIPMIYFEIQ